VEWLTGDLTVPFRRVKDRTDRLEDRSNGVTVDLPPAGGVLKKGCRVPFPEPTKATDELEIIPLEELISLKLDSWASSPSRRLKEKADVTELILRLKLARDLAVHPAVQPFYREAWDALQAEQ
jgi:hypothetical protein